MEVEGVGCGKDFKLYPGGGRAWDWRETKTEHVPGIQPADVQELLDKGSKVVVLSRGMQLMLQTCPETLRLLKDKASTCAWKRPGKQRNCTTGWLRANRLVASSILPAEVPMGLRPTECDEKHCLWQAIDSITTRPCFSRERVAGRGLPVTTDLLPFTCTLSHPAADLKAPSVLDAGEGQSVS
jgi:hypothetical protein